MAVLFCSALEDAVVAFLLLDEPEANCSFFFAAIYCTITLALIFHNSRPEGIEPSQRFWRPLFYR